jgi:hypothetical protein
MVFDPKIALDYARKISRPRLVGTIEEKKVAQEIADQLTLFGFTVNFQPFQFSSSLGIFLTAEIITGQVLILTTILTYGVSQWLTLMQIVLLVFLIAIIGPINKKVQTSSIQFEDNEHPTLWSSICWRLGAHYKTKNIIAALPNISDGPALPDLYLVAHYDSKSQRIPLVIRIALFVIVIIGSLIFAGLNLLGLVNEIFTPFSIVIGSVVVLAGIPLLFLGYGNDSPGAIDDASGVGLVLHLVEVIAKQPTLIEKLRITVLITSAEELAVMGAQTYVKQNQFYLRRQAEAGGLHVLNFDGIGVDGKLYLVGDERRIGQSPENNLFSLVRQSCKELGFSIGRFSLPGAMLDHIPFAEDQYDAVSIIGLGKSTWSIHTPKDSPGKLHIRGFEQAGRLAIRVIEKLSGSEINSKQNIHLE